MNSFLSWIQVHILSWIKPPKTIHVIDVIQVLLIAYFIYHLILWLKNTRAYTLLRGILLIVAFVILANILDMEVIVWLMGNLGVAAFTAAIIIFQPELRKALEQFGHKSHFSNLFAFRDDGLLDLRFSDHTLEEIVRSCYSMGEVFTGALIVIERDIQLEDYKETGIPVDGVVSGQLLINIFEKNTPLHDGAVIISSDRIAAATCYLPLSDNAGLNKSLGTRHRAGVGVSEVTDAFVIIVSEETGKVSYALDGEISVGVTSGELRDKLHQIQKKKEPVFAVKSDRKGGDADA